MANDTHREIKVKLLKNQKVIADKCVVAESFVQRLFGLMGRTRLATGEGVYFPQCTSVHMYFMRIPLDIVFVRPGSEQGQFLVTSAHRNVRPWRPLPIFDFKSKDCIELPTGTIQQTDLREGDELWLSN